MTRPSFALALIADLLGACGVLLFAGRDWQRVVVSRVRPLPDAVADLSGHDLHGAITAFALIALAGVVAIAATRGWGRALVGLALIAAGALIGWYSVDGVNAVSAAQARSSVAGGIGVDAQSVPHVTVHATWPALTAASGALIVVAGVLAVVNARRWRALASRYEAPTGGARAERAERGSPDIAMWSALDRGDDPTTRTES
jgi:uncharacterized membrane protein (TIGR02234 family)